VTSWEEGPIKISLVLLELPQILLSIVYRKVLKKLSKSCFYRYFDYRT